MDNYLSKLVDRALSRAPVIQPRRASLFAPSPYAAGLLGRAANVSFSPQHNLQEATFAQTTQVDPAAQDADSARDMNAQTQATPAQEQRTHLEADDTGQRIRSRATRPQPLDVNVAQESFTSPQAQTVHRPSAPRATSLRTEHTQSETAAPRASSPVHAFSETEQDQARLATVRPHDRRAAELDESAHAAEAKLAVLRARLGRDEQEVQQFEGDIARAHTQARRRSEAADERENLAHTPPDAHDDAAHARQKQREQRAAEAAHVPQNKEQAPSSAQQIVRVVPAPVMPRRAAAEAVPRAPAPTVQVTIGRIEVRATNAPAPARHTNVPAPRLSLEEYLRQRSGGHR
jgi:hypothetical protein